MHRLLVVAAIGWAIFSGWSQSPILVVAAFSEQQTEAAQAALERLKPLLDDRKALQHEAAQLGYTVVWEGETAMLFPQSLTTASRASRALQFLEAFREDLKRLGYRAGQPIAGDALSEATLDALANLLGTPPDSALMRELRDGTRAIALDVVVAPRLRDGSPVVFSDIKNIPTLSRLEPNPSPLVAPQTSFGNGGSRTRNCCSRTRRSQAAPMTDNCRNGCNRRIWMSGGRTLCASTSRACWNWRQWNSRRSAT